MRREVGAVTGTTRERTRDAACAAPGALLKQEERSTTEQHHARHSGTTQQATGV